MCSVGVQGDTGVYRVIQVCARGYRCVQGIQVCTRWIHVCTRGYRWVQGDTGVCRGIQVCIVGDTCEYSGDIGVYRGIQVHTRGHRCVQGDIYIIQIMHEKIHSVSLTIELCVVRISVN